MQEAEQIHTGILEEISTARELSVARWAHYCGGREQRDA
jgi:hypothetical protein